MLSATEVLVGGYSWHKIPNFRSLILDTVNRTHIYATVLLLLGSRFVVKGGLVFIRSSGRVDMVAMDEVVVGGEGPLVVIANSGFVVLVTRWVLVELDSGQIVFGSMPICLLCIKLTLLSFSVKELTCFRLSIYLFYNIHKFFFINTKQVKIYLNKVAEKNFI